MPSLLPLTSLAPATTRHHRFINILPFKASDDLVAVTARVTYDITIPLAVNRRLHTKDLLSHLMFTVGAVGWVELEVQTKVNGVKIDASAVVERVMGLLDVNKHALAVSSISNTSREMHGVHLFRLHPSFLSPPQDLLRNGSRLATLDKITIVFGWGRSKKKGKLMNVQEESEILSDSENEMDTSPTTLEDQHSPNLMQLTLPACYEAPIDLIVHKFMTLCLHQKFPLIFHRKVLEQLRSEAVGINKIADSCRGMMDRSASRKVKHRAENFLENIRRLRRSTGDLRCLILSSDPLPRTTDTDQPSNIPNDEVTTEVIWHTKNPSSPAEKDHELEDTLRAVMLQMEMVKFGKPRLKFEQLPVDDKFTPFKLLQPPPESRSPTVYPATQPYAIQSPHVGHTLAGQSFRALALGDHPDDLILAPDSPASPSRSPVPYSSLRHYQEQDRVLLPVWDILVSDDEMSDILSSDDEAVQSPVFNLLEKVHREGDGHSDEENGDGDNLSIYSKDSEDSDCILVDDDDDEMFLRSYSEARNNGGTYDHFLQHRRSDSPDSIIDDDFAPPESPVRYLERPRQAIPFLPMNTLPTFARPLPQVSISRNHQSSRLCGVRDASQGDDILSDSE